MFKRILLTLLALCLLLGPAASAFAAQESPYRIEVDIANQITTVYRCADDVIVRQMICSTGIGDATPRGTFYLASRPTDRKEWYFIGKYQCYVRYPTRIRGPILFHSLPYADTDLSTVDEQARAQLGARASHGCVRLRWEDAAWIAQNCPDGTETRIYTGATRRNALRARLLEGSYSEDSGTSYDCFITTLANEVPAALARGDEGEDVEILQRMLGKLGWFNAPLTGIYDDATVVAVMRYQAAAGLPASGCATPALIAYIEAEAKK